MNSNCEALRLEGRAQPTEQSLSTVPCFNEIHKKNTWTFMPSQRLELMQQALHPSLPEHPPP